MEKMTWNEKQYDVIVDDGGACYYLQFTAGPMTAQEVVEDFMAGYDGEISAEEIEVIFPDAEK